MEAVVTQEHGALSRLALQERIDLLERALRIIETEVYGRPEPYCRRIAAEIVEVLGVAPD